MRHHDPIGEQLGKARRVVGAQLAQAQARRLERDRQRKMPLR